MDMQLRDARSEADKVCIIGAGSSGLAAAKTFSERGIPFDCLERENDIGGFGTRATNTGVVYDTTYLVSSRKYTGFEDYPFPEDYPTYPSHRETMAYLRDYALNFGILDRSNSTPLWKTSSAPMTAGASTSPATDPPPASIARSSSPTATIIFRVSRTSPANSPARSCIRGTIAA